MATIQTRWLLSILLANLPNCSLIGVSIGPPSPPSPPDCYIPCDEKNCFVHINCTWDPRQEPRIPTNYSLHWEPANREEDHVTSRTSVNNLIHRSHFRNHGDLRVWVQAKNQHGSSKSQEAVFNTADILKPLPPKVISSHSEAIEIHWKSSCDQLQLSVGPCDVRYRTEENQVWLEDEEGFYGSYTIDNPQNCTNYEFQVRCACATGLMSDWSAIHRVQAIETTPIGELDVWRDCGVYLASFECVVTWKRLPMSQACGCILGYAMTLFYRNGTAVRVNVTESGPRRQLVCDERQCHLTSSVKDASSVSVSAYNTHGATRPSCLAMPLPGKEKNEQSLHLKMNSKNFTVSWDPPSQLSDMKEYVVQYKQAGSGPGQAFDWVKLNKSQTRAFFIGQFKNYTPYQVSAFSVSHKSEAHHLSSVIGYSLQRAPSRVQSFKVFSIAATDVTLFWEPLTLFKQNGVILYYQIGLDGQKVYNVSTLSQHENKTFQLQHLSPGQEYEVWIRAVSAAGPGEKATTRFKTKHHEHFGYLSVSLGIISLFVICILLVVWACYRKNKACLLFSSCYCDKVPDPNNSHIFREMKHQINEPMAWICIPNNEPNPKISLLEVVVIQPWTSKSSLEKTADADRLTPPKVWGGSSQTDCQNVLRDDDVTEESHRTDHKCEREAYSKMVDSDEEKSWSSSEEEHCTSGYEKHFMPTGVDVIGVS